MSSKLYILVILFILILFSGCGHKENAEYQKPTEIPYYIKELENVTLFSPDTQSADTIELVREQVFERNEDVFINGYIGEMAVDERDRVYITATKLGVVNIYVFDREGNYLTNIGREGRGPGELESIGSISIENDRLYLFDPRLQKFMIYSLDDFSLVKEELIKRNKLKKTDTLAYALKGNELHATGNNNLLLSLRRIGLEKDEDMSKIGYYRLSSDGEIHPNRILELDRFRFYFPKTKRNPDGYIRRPMPMPFSRSSLVVVSGEGKIYTAWTEDFLIKEYDLKGNYRWAIYYPYQNRELNISNLELGNARLRAIDENSDQIPDSWPALHAMEVDDQNRLWIFTITDSDSTYKGWVLNSNGELQARFDIPGVRADRSVMAPFFDPVIRNGYLYRRERDISSGIDRVIKYKISFK